MHMKPEQQATNTLDLSETFYNTHADSLPDIHVGLWMEGGANAHKHSYNGLLYGHYFFKKNPKTFVHRSTK